MRYRINKLCYNTWIIARTDGGYYHSRSFDSLYAAEAACRELNAIDARLNGGEPEAAKPSISNLAGYDAFSRAYDSLQKGAK